jgi:hypothetical protein
MGQELILDPSLLAIPQPPRQPREGGMAVARLWNAKPIPSGPPVYGSGVETSSTQNPQGPGERGRLGRRRVRPRVRPIEKPTGLRPQNVQPPREGAWWSTRGGRAPRDQSQRRLRRKSRTPTARHPLIFEKRCRAVGGKGAQASRL